MLHAFPTCCVKQQTVQTLSVSLCSNAKQMPASVCDALKGVFQQEGGVSAEEAEQMLTAMERTGRLQSETWS